jgi:hypothetical protein
MEDYMQYAMPVTYSVSYNEETPSYNGEWNKDKTSNSIHYTHNHPKYSEIFEKTEKLLNRLMDGSSDSEDGDHDFTNPQILLEQIKDQVRACITKSTFEISIRSEDDPEDISEIEIGFLKRQRDLDSELLQNIDESIKDVRRKILAADY